jgi:hypothetical protein
VRTPSCSVVVTFGLWNSQLVVRFTNTSSRASLVTRTSPAFPSMTRTRTGPVTCDCERCFQPTDAKAAAVSPPATTTVAARTAIFL